MCAPAKAGSFQNCLPKLVTQLFIIFPKTNTCQRPLKASVYYGSHCSEARHLIFPWVNKANYG